MRPDFNSMLKAAFGMAFLMFILGGVLLWGIWGGYPEAWQYTMAGTGAAAGLAIWWWTRDAD